MGRGFGELQDAITRLSVVVPLSFASIGVLLLVNFASLTDAMLAASVISTQDCRVVAPAA
jgi:heavy metal efflux system protein